VEANPKEIESESAHHIVPMEEAAVKTIGALEDQYGDRYLAIRRRQQPKKWTQGDGGSWRKLAAPFRWMTCCARDVFS
jgi:hypothetical protein